MPTYDGIGETITHKLEIEGDLFLQDIEGGSLSTQVPLEIFSDFETSGPEAINSRMLRLRVQNYGETDVSNSYVTDFGIRGEADKDYFFITAPQNTSNVGDQNTFVISSTSNVGIGTTDPGHYRLLVNNSSTKHFGVPGNDTPSTGDTLVYNEDGEWVYHFVEGTLPPGTVDNEILTWNGSNWVPNSSIITTNSNTSIGIGTYTPSANLHVIGSVTATTDVDISGKFQGGKLRVGSLLSAVPTNPNVTVPGDLTVSGTLTSDAWIHTDDVTINGNIDVTGTITASNIVGGSPLTITSDENLQVNSNLTVGTSNLFVDNLAGRVGIGVVSPGAPLEVVSTRNADTWSSGASQLNVLNYNGSGSWYGMSFAVSQSRGNGVIQTFNKNSGAAAYHLELQPSAGNVGIGTDSPLRKLDVRSGDAVVATNWISGAFGPELSAGDRVVIGNLYGKACIGAHNSGLTGWADLTINSAGGNVGIGTVSPSYALHVQSSTNPQMLIGNSSGGGGNIYFGNGNHGVGRGTGKINFTDVNDVVLHTAGSGNAGLATNYANYYLKLTNGGVVLHNGSTVHSSDDRIKINEERITNATETLMKLDPQIYDKTIDINSSNVFGREAGLIIQDVWYDAPELRYLVLPADDANPSEEKPQRSDNIQEDPDYSDWGSKSGHFNYTGLIPYLIKSNQEQQALIDDLDTQLQDEKQKMASLLARIEALENSS